MYIFLVSFRGQKKLGPRPDRSPLVNSKFPTSIPTPFICGVPPGSGRQSDDQVNKIIKQKNTFQQIFPIFRVVSQTFFGGRRKRKMKLKHKGLKI